jgi:hypothetical protein
MLRKDVNAGTIRKILHEIEDMTADRNCGKCKNFRYHYSRNPMECDEGCIVENSPFYESEDEYTKNCPYWTLKLDDGVYEGIMDELLEGD